MNGLNLKYTLINNLTEVNRNFLIRFSPYFPGTQRVNYSQRHLTTASKILQLLGEDLFVATIEKIVQHGSDNFIRKFRKIGKVEFWNR